MVEKQPTKGNLALQNNAPRVIVINPAKKPESSKLRVAAYARVSSASEDQLNSFAAQSRYYTKLISEQENWSLVDVYADQGITGTSAEKRGDFQRLMSDCRRGLIDRVLVKSISRFARNTKECLEAVRELKTLGVSVCFEKEHIDTGTMSGEMVTALFAAFAQAESQSISSNMRWSYQRRMQSGTFLPSSVPYGYRMDDNRIVIEKTEADVIRWIFDQYLSGCSTNKIADILNRNCVRNRGNKHWHHTSVSYILTNERYIGDSLWQKTYASDTFPVKYLRNSGEKEQYYAKETHPAIIEPEVYRRAQEMILRRHQKFTCEHPMIEYPLRQRLLCKNCGRSLRRKVIRGVIYWCCPQHDKSPVVCNIKQLEEQQIYAIFCRLYYKLKHPGDPILSEIITSLQKIRSRRMLWSLDIVELNKRISELSSQNQMLAALKQQGLIDPDIFISQSNELTEQLRAAKLDKERLLAADGDDTIDRTQELMEILEAGPDFLDHFDGELFGELIDKIIVDSNEQVRFRLKNGLELTETIERTVR